MKRLAAYFTCHPHGRINLLSLRSITAIGGQFEPAGFVATLRLKLRGQMKCKKYDVGFCVDEAFWKISQQIQFCSVVSMCDAHSWN